MPKGRQLSSKTATHKLTACSRLNYDILGMAFSNHLYGKDPME